MAMTATIVKLRVRNLFIYSVMGRVRQFLGAEENDTKYDAQIKSMDKSEVFDACLKWEGIIGYDSLIKKWVEQIWKVELE